jgi:hypothetical protein
MKNRCKKLLLLLLLVGITPAMMAQYGFGTSTPDKNAAVDITSTTKGFLPPRMNTTQLKAFTDANPTPEGYIVFDTDRHCLAYYVNKSFTCTSVSFTANAPTVTLNAPSVTGYTVSFTKTYSHPNSIPEGSSVIKWYTAGSSSGAGSQVVVGASALSYTLPSSSCGAFVRASYTPVASNGEMGAEVFTSWVVVGGSININHRTAGGVAPVDGNITYKTQLIGAAGAEKCWILQNLGATTQAINPHDASDQAAGWYFQYNCLRGRKYDNGLIPTTGWHTLAVIVDNWERSTDPCTASFGPTWHAPSIREWNEMWLTLPNPSPDGAFASPLRFHANGYIDVNKQHVIGNWNNLGGWWLSEGFHTEDGIYRYVHATLGFVGGFTSQLNGLNLRCVREFDE